MSQTNEPLPSENLRLWSEAQRNFLYWKAKEMELRQQVLKEYFPEPKNGTNSRQLPNGWRLKAAIKETAKLDADTPKINAICGQLQSAGMPNELIARLIKWEPELSQGEYNKLPEQWRSIIAPIVVVKPGAPTLEIVPDKRG